MSVVTAFLLVAFLSGLVGFILVMTTFSSETVINKSVRIFFALFLSAIGFVIPMALIASGINDSVHKYDHGAAVQILDERGANFYRIEGRYIMYELDDGFLYKQDELSKVGKPKNHESEDTN